MNVKSTPRILNAKPFFEICIYYHFEDVNNISSLFI